jgi:hypothetical protein
VNRGSASTSRSACSFPMQRLLTKTTKSRESHKETTIVFFVVSVGFRGFREEIGRHDLKLATPGGLP